MPVFVVVLNRRPEKVLPNIHALPEENRFQIKHDAWLIDFNGTTRALAEKLGIRGIETGGATGVVFPTTNFSGRASSDTWEWLKLHMSDRGE